MHKHDLNQPVPKLMNEQTKKRKNKLTLVVLFIVDTKCIAEKIIYFCQTLEFKWKYELVSLKWKYITNDHI